jgi:hypothetical protein
MGSKLEYWFLLTKILFLSLNRYSDVLRESTSMSRSPKQKFLLVPTLSFFQAAILTTFDFQERVHRRKLVPPEYSAAVVLWTIQTTPLYLAIVWNRWCRDVSNQKTIVC